MEGNKRLVVAGIERYISEIDMTADIITDDNDITDKRTGCG